MQKFSTYYQLVIINLLTIAQLSTVNSVCILYNYYFIKKCYLKCIIIERIYISDILRS